jgi:hypothetical protein
MIEPGELTAEVRDNVEHCGVVDEITEAPRRSEVIAEALTPDIGLVGRRNVQQIHRHIERPHLVGARRTM